MIPSGDSQLRCTSITVLNCGRERRESRVSRAKVSASSSRARCSISHSVSGLGKFDFTPLADGVGVGTHEREATDDCRQ